MKKGTMKMKKTLTVLLLLTFILSTFSLSASAGSYNYGSGTPAGVTAIVRKTAGVTIDGVISEGEYEKLNISTAEGSSFLNMCYGSDAMLEYAKIMRSSIEYYASWSDGVINVAVRNCPPTGIIQTIPTKDGTYPEDWFCENVAYTISSDVTQKPTGRQCNFYFAGAKRTDTGEYQVGYYTSNQWGNSGSYKPTAGVDFAISYDYDTGWCTLEWSVPFSEICRGGVAHAGDCVYLSIGAEAGTGDGSNSPSGIGKAYAVSLGDFTYLVDGRITLGNHASFKLSDAAVGSDPSEDPTQPTDPSAEDPSAGKIVISSVRAKPGATVTVDVAVVDNPGFSSFIATLEYDETRLILDDVAVADGIGGQLNFSRRIAWVNNSDYTENGSFLTLTFTVKDGAEDGEALITMSYDTGDISNYEESDVNFAVVRGSVHVSSHLPGDVNGDDKVNSKDLTRLLKYFSGEDVEVFEADVNGDGKVNSKDLTRLLKYLSGEDVEIF